MNTQKVLEPSFLYTSIEGNITFREWNCVSTSITIVPCSNSDIWYQQGKNMNFLELFYTDTRYCNDIGLVINEDMHVILRHDCKLPPYTIQGSDMFLCAMSVPTIQGCGRKDDVEYRKNVTFGFHLFFWQRKSNYDVSAIASGVSFTLSLNQS